MYFFFNDTATTEIYTLSLHDALPICSAVEESTASSAEETGVDVNGDRDKPYEWKKGEAPANREEILAAVEKAKQKILDRKSTRLNSSHSQISYAVFCLKKKKKK